MLAVVVNYSILHYRGKLKMQNYIRACNLMSIPSPASSYSLFFQCGSHANSGVGTLMQIMTSWFVADNLGTATRGDVILDGFLPDSRQNILQSVWLHTI